MKDYVLVRIQSAKLDIERDITKNYGFKYRVFGPKPDKYHPGGKDIDHLVLEMFDDKYKKFVPSIGDRMVTCNPPGFGWNGNGKTESETISEFCTPVSARELKEFTLAVKKAIPGSIMYNKKTSYLILNHEVG